jgi:hypothetical protein
LACVRGSPIYARNLGIYKLNVKNKKNLVLGIDRGLRIG